MELTEIKFNIDMNALSDIDIHQKMLKKRAPNYTSNIDITQLKMIDCKVSSRNLCNNEACYNCYNKSMASHPKSCNWSSSDAKRPRYVTKGSNYKAIFNCDNCCHSFSKRIVDVVKGGWCQYCCVGRSIICSDIDCKYCEDRSLISCEAGKYIVDKNIDPRLIIRGSREKILFKCWQCNHTMENVPAEVYKRWVCKYCSHQSLCSDLSCQMCFNNSAASVIKKENWSDLNGIDLRFVFRTANTKYKFICDKCNHDFEATLGSISNGQWCPYCGHAKLCSNDNCEMCYNNSFASHFLAKYWSPRNISKPRQIYKTSGNKYHFNCQYCNEEFHVVLAPLTKNTGCGKCKHKTEYLLYKYLSEKFKVTPQANFSFCISDKGVLLRYDFMINDHGVLIELDGGQHFQENIFNQDLEKLVNRDVYKMHQALLNGYTIIRISQEDVWHEKINLDECLLPNIKIYDEPKLIFISSKENLYEKHHTKFLEKCLLYNIGSDEVKVTFIH